jgi:hypothetical protein
MPPPADAHSQLYIERLEDDRWTWRYVEGESDVELHSNETFSSREAAVDWARRAYPDVPFADAEGDADEDEEDDEDEEG